MAELLCYGEPWKKITSLVTKQPNRCCVAVAYFGKGASKLLPLGNGSTLVVDLSERAVRSGQTNPSEVLKLVNRGVDAWSVSNLHAKVFVIGRRALVGSTNASNTSANGLVEAVLDTSESGAVSACRRFIMNLRAEPATPEYLKRLRKLWRPPKFGLGGNGSAKGNRNHPVPEHATVWVVPLEYTTYDTEDEEAKDRSHARAKRRIGPARLYHLDDFKLEGSWTGLLRTNDIAAQVVDEGKQVRMVHGPEHVLDIEPYKKGRARAEMVSLEAVKKHRRKNLRVVLRRLPSSGQILKQAKRPRKLRDALLAHALMNLWPQPQRTAKR